ncbi:unnamed protein product [Cochlearia groenlandica]
MEDEEIQNNSRVVKVNSTESWDFYLNQAKNQGCPVVAHFTTSWCIPSVYMNSYFQDLASTYKDALFLIVDVDEVKEVAKRLQVKAMPTFMFLKDGNVMDKLVGANPDEIKKRVESFVQSSRVVHVAN